MSSRIIFHNDWDFASLCFGSERNRVAGGLGRAIPETSRNERKIAGAILACWSLVHGLTLLLADGLVGPKKKAGALGDRLVQGILHGLADELPVLPPGTWVGPQTPQSQKPASSNS